MATFDVTEKMMEELMGGNRLGEFESARRRFRVEAHDYDFEKAANTMPQGVIKAFEFDADRIAKFKGGGELWQGTYPPVGDALKRLGFSVVVLAAEEYQPQDDEFEGVEVIHAPNDDAPIAHGGDTALALRVSEQVAKALRDGKKVLSTCAAGLNRSGLVSAFALMRVNQTATGPEIVAKVRKARGEWALSNRDFERAVLRLTERRAGRKAQ